MSTKHTLDNGSTLTMLDDGGALIECEHDDVHLSAGDVAAIVGDAHVEIVADWRSTSDALIARAKKAESDLACMTKRREALLAMLGGEPAPRAKSDVHPLFSTFKGHDGLWTAHTRGISSAGHVTQEGAAAHSWTLAKEAGSEPAPRVSELTEALRLIASTYCMGGAEGCSDGVDCRETSACITEWCPVCVAKSALKSSPGANRGEDAGTPASGCQPNPSGSNIGTESGGVFRDEFRTTHMDEPLSTPVLRHNAYAAGWEHGALDHRPPAPYWDTLRRLGLGLLDLYTRGREDGEAARSRGWATAREHRGDPPVEDRNTDLDCGKPVAMAFPMPGLWTPEGERVEPTEEQEDAVAERVRSWVHGRLGPGLSPEERNVLAWVLDREPAEPTKPLPGGHTDALDAITEGAFSSEQIDAEPEPEDRSEPPAGYWVERIGRGEWTWGVIIDGLPTPASSSRDTEDEVLAESWGHRDAVLASAQLERLRAMPSGHVEPGLADQGTVTMSDIARWLRLLNSEAFGATEYLAEVQGMLKKVDATCAVFDRVTRDAVTEPKPDDLDCGKPVAMGHGNDYQCERAAGHKGRCGELWEGQELGERALAKPDGVIPDDGRRAWAFGYRGQEDAWSHGVSQGRLDLELEQSTSWGPKPASAQLDGLTLANVTNAENAIRAIRGRLDTNATDEVARFVARVRRELERPEPTVALLDDLCEWLDHVDASGGMSELTAMGDGLVAAIRARYDGRNSGHVEPELSHCGECAKHTRFGTQQTCMECNAMRLVDAPPEWLVELEKLAPGRCHIGRWVLDIVTDYDASGGFDASGTREDLIEWRVWATMKVRGRRCDDMRERIDALLAKVGEERDAVMVELEAADRRIHELVAESGSLRVPRQQDEYETGRAAGLREAAKLVEGFCDGPLSPGDIYTSQAIKKLAPMILGLANEEDEEDEEDEEGAAKPEEVCPICGPGCALGTSCESCHNWHCSCAAAKPKDPGAMDASSVTKDRDTWDNDAELVLRAVRSCGAGGARLPRWSHVGRVFGLGSGYSAKLVQRCGLDPDELVGQEEDDGE